MEAYGSCHPKDTKDDIHLIMKTIPAYSKWDGGISAHQQLIHTRSGVPHLAISEQTDDRGSNVSRRVRLICDVLDRWREASNIVLGWCRMMSPLGVWIGRWKAMRTICPKIAKIAYYERAGLSYMMTGFGESTFESDGKKHLSRCSRSSIESRALFFVKPCVLWWLAIQVP